MTTPTDRPDGKFEQLWLPLWPLASDNLRDGIYRTSRHKALGKRYVEANGPDPRKVDTSGVSYAAWVSVADVSASKASGARRLHQ